MIAVGGSKRFNTRASSYASSQPRTTIVVVACSWCAEPVMVPSDAAKRLASGRSRIACENCIKEADDFQRWANETGYVPD